MGQPRQYAVAFISFFDNELSIQLVRANDVRSAVLQHTVIAGFELNGTTLEDLKREFFDCDAMVDCVEIPPVPAGV